MKKQIIANFIIVILLLNLTGCGITASTSSLVTGDSTDTATPKTIATKTVRNPQEISSFSISDESIYDGKPFQYHGQEYQIKEHRIKGAAEEDDLYLYWTLHQINPSDLTNQKEPKQNLKQEIPLVDPQEISRLDLLEKQKHPTCYILDNVFFLSNYLFYSYQECVTKPFGKNGEEHNWGNAMLCRINLETMEIDQNYTLITKQERDREISFQIWGADPDSGYIYLNRAGNLLALDLSLAKVDMTEFDSSEYILDIYWSEEGYVLTDIGIYQMSLALDKNNQLEKPKVICTWPSDLNKGYAKAIGTYGRFLYGYTYYHGNYAIAGHYFQVDLDGNRCNILSADSKYDAECNFNTESFADKHVLYSEGRDNSDHSWDPIQVRYILSEDGSVEIETEKISQ